MIFWIDAQLPPSLAPWLTGQFGVQAQSMRFLGLQAAEDADIFERARAAGDIVIVSKDSDFIEIILRRGIPPRLIWVTCGNLTNRWLREVFSSVLEESISQLQAGESIVEIGDA